MKYIKTGWMIVLVFWCFVRTGEVSAVSDIGHGRVKVRGSIVETACAIDMESRAQSIEFGVIPLGEIIRNGQTSSVPFIIRLTNCVLTRLSPEDENWKFFTVTFKGNGAVDYFKTTGAASGVAIKIYDEKQKIILPDEETKPIPLKNGEHSVRYFMSLISDGKPFRSGNFFSSIQYKIDYY